MGICGKRSTTQNVNNINFVGVNLNSDPSCSPHFLSLKPHRNRGLEQRQQSLVLVPSGRIIPQECLRPKRSTMGCERGLV